MKRIALLLSLGALGVGCTHTDTLQYDYSRCYRDTMALQADRNRPSAIGTAYVMGGVEAIEIRARSEEAATDQESTTAESTAKVAVE